MMPSATIMTTTPTSKPRISNFSIESIVGNKIKSSNSPNNHQYLASGEDSDDCRLIRPMPVAAAEMKQNMPQYPHDMLAAGAHNPHFLAQFQAAAALAHAQASQGFPPQGFPQHPSHMQNVPRDSYPLYPWLLSRHGRIFPHRFPGNFLLQPFRKPKRVRTAFSPTQLLKLEHAFEGNHYVVGAERKTLAQQLHLSETQVKVWFQNRRTKHKRMQDDSKSGDGDNRSNSPKNYDEEDDELIDMEMDEDCPSDDDGDNM
ncbi:unnamed protein product, partial [Diamesa serratosioi]